jgi:hypothetical protein
LIPTAFARTRREILAVDLIAISAAIQPPNELVNEIVKVFWADGSLSAWHGLVFPHLAMHMAAWISKVFPLIALRSSVAALPG